MGLWSTNAEIRFLKGLGSFIEHKSYHLPKLESLLRCKAGMIKRTQWDDIDRDKVLKFLDEMIANESRKSE